VILAMQFYPHERVFADSPVELLGLIGIIVTVITVVASAISWWHHVNCIERGCWRKGHPSLEHGHPVCRRHTNHPHPSLGATS
jgi:hypothetical protein